MKLWLLALALFAPILAPSCFLKPASDGCTPGHSQCAGTQVRVCNGDGRWTTLHDCESLAAFSGARLVCEADGSAAACLVRDASAE